MENKPKLSECEEMILSILLNSDEDLTLTEIMDRAKARFQKEWKMQTVATFMKRMEEKGYISSYKIGRYSHYKSVITLCDFRKYKMQDMRELLLFDSTESMADFIKNM